jgi:hypothetical protein
MKKLLFSCLFVILGTSSSYATLKYAFDIRVDSTSEAMGGAYCIVTQELGNSNGRSVWQCEFEYGGRMDRTFYVDHIGYYSDPGAPYVTYGSSTVLQVAQFLLAGVGFDGLEVAGYDEMKHIFYYNDCTMTQSVSLRDVEFEEGIEISFRFAGYFD